MTNPASSRRKPQRTCLGCRKIRNKDELIRVVRTAEGEILIDPGGRMNGRGAYLCRDSACLMRAAKTGALQRALKTPVPEDIVPSLLKMLEQEDEKNRDEDESRGQ